MGWDELGMGTKMGPQQQGWAEETARCRAGLQGLCRSKGNHGCAGFPGTRWALEAGLSGPGHGYSRLQLCRVASP